jgi:hypothetical protein
VTVRDVEYEADGRQVVGRLALPDGEGPAPAVLVAHEGPGPDDARAAATGPRLPLNVVAGDADTDNSRTALRPGVTDIPRPDT